jgi:hypothetical protein
VVPASPTLHQAVAGAAFSIPPPRPACLRPSGRLFRRLPLLTLIAACPLLTVIAGCPLLTLIADRAAQSA